MAAPIIAITDVVKEFRGGVRALDGLSLTIPEGVIYGLLGPNGAGKTTLIRIMATLLRADAGHVMVAGFDAHRDPEAVRRRIGLAGQNAAVDDHLTGRENIEMVGRLYGLSRHDARRRTSTILEGIHLGEAADRRVKTYSGGMRRRIDLAASLVGRPQVLFLDEPTTGVDPASRRELWNLVRDLVDDGTTAVLTTQYLDEADQLAQRIGVIDRGRLIGEGTPAQLKTRAGGAVLQLSIVDTDHAVAMRALQDVDPEPATYDPGHGTLTLAARHGVDTLRMALHVLEQAGVHPIDVGLHKPTLDDVFLAMTRPGASRSLTVASSPRRPGEPS